VPPAHDRIEGDPTAHVRRTQRTHRRLQRLRADLERARTTQRELTAQVDHLVGIADDATTEAVVAGHEPAARDARAATSDLDRHRRLLDATRQEITDLLAEQDRLLDRLQELTDPHRSPS
jgi:chromosome segregation ATPase